MPALKLYYSSYTPSAATASSAQAVYPASNAITTQVNKPWTATSAGAEWLQFDLGASRALAAICVHGVNFATAQVYADNSATPTTLVGTLTMGMDDNGRFKGSLAVATTARYVRVSIAAGTPLSGATWSAGNLSVFAAALSPPVDPLYGNSKVKSVIPQSLTDLDNGVSVVDTIGPQYTLATLEFSGGATTDLAQLMRTARTFGTCWVDLGTPNRGEQWPMRHFEPDVTRTFAAYNRETMSLSFKEMV